MFSIWRENMLGYLSADIIWFEKRTVTENCELRRTDNVQGKRYEYIFKAKWRLFDAFGEYHRIFPGFYLGHIQSRDAFRFNRVRAKILI